MKNANQNNPGQQGFPLTISASVDEVNFLQDLVEKLAYRRENSPYIRRPMPCGQVAVDTSSLEAYISGTIDIAGDGENMHIPYTTCFMFTCIKGRRDNYNLSWSNSLS